MTDADLQSHRARLRDILLTHSIKTGDFLLASGKRSNVYVDVRKTALRADGSQDIGALLWDAIRSLDAIDGVGGMTLGADPILTAVTCCCDDPNFGAIIVRKESKGHGTDQALEIAGGLVDGAHIVALDDVVTTAGSTIKAIHALRAQGFVIDHAMCVVDRESGGEDALNEIGVQLTSLFSISELIQ